MGLIISLMAGITNMFLDFLFMYVLKIGIIRAALATGISQIVGGIIPLIYFKTNASTRLKLVRTRFEVKVVGQASANGASEMMTNLSMSLVNMLYNMQLMKIVGSDGVVAYGIIMYVNGFISALISFLRTLVFQAIMIFLLPAILGINGIWLAVVAAELLSLIVSTMCFSINNKRYGYA